MSTKNKFFKNDSKKKNVLIGLVCVLLISLSLWVLKIHKAWADLPAAEKEIGTFEGDRFVPRENFFVGEEAIVKIKIRGGEGRRREKPDIILVMDKSGSMSFGWLGDGDFSFPRKIESAKKVLKNFVDNSDPKFDRIGFIVYSTVSIPQVSLATEFGYIKERIDLMSASGSTSIGAGLNDANKELNSRGRAGSPHYIILATDGLQNTAPSVYQNDILKKAIDNGYVVYTIGIGNDSEGNQAFFCCPDLRYCASYCPPEIDTGRKYLEDVAAKTGGKYYFAPDEETLERIYEDIKEEISYSWGVSLQDTINYSFSNPELIKVTDGYGNEVTHNLTVSGNTLSGDLGSFPAGEERIIFVKVRVAGKIGTDPWKGFLDDEARNNKVIYKDPAGNIVKEEKIGNKTITIFSGKIQGRLFHDLNENGFMDFNETFIDEGIGSVSISPKRTREDPPNDGCPVNSSGYRFKDVLPNINHSLTLQSNTSDWVVTGAYYTHGGNYCERNGFSAEWKKISESELRADNVTVWSESPITNLWLGVKYNPLACRGITATPDFLLVGGSTQLSADVLGSNLTYSWNVTPEIGYFDGSTKESPSYTAPLLPPAGGKVSIGLTLSDSTRSVACPSIDIPIKERVIQGRFFKDDGGLAGTGVAGNGKKDGDEEFIDPPAGTTLEVLKGGQSLGGATDVPVDICGVQKGYRSSNNLAVGSDYGVVANIQNTDSRWHFTGAYYTQAQSQTSCTNLPQCTWDPLCGDTGDISTDKRLFRISGVDLTQTVVNLWFGLGWQLCENTPPANVAPANSCKPPGNITWSWTSHPHTTDFWIQLSADGATNPDGSFVSTIGQENRWLGSNLPSYTFFADAPTYQGSNLYFIVKSANSCGQHSEWSLPERVYVDERPVITSFTQVPLVPDPTTSSLELNVSFSSRSSGSYTFSYEAHDSNGALKESDTYTDRYIVSPLMHTPPTHTFNLANNLVAGDRLTSRVSVEADNWANTPSGPNCDVDTASTSGGVAYDPWMQVINGDVYSNYKGPDPGIRVYVQEAPKPPWEAYFLKAGHAEGGGINIAREELELKNPVLPPGKSKYEVLSERVWNVKNYPDEIKWPLELLNKIKGSDSMGQVKIEYYETLPQITSNIIKAEPTIIFVNRDDIIIGDTGIEPMRIEALLIAKTGSISIRGVTQLLVRGGLYAYKGFELEDREATDNKMPAIVVEQDPRFVLYSHPRLYSPFYSWKEVEPR